MSSDSRTLDQVHNTCERAIEILRATHDGDDLDPIHLKIVEMAVNGFLNEDGEKKFDEIYAQCKPGPYVKPWFHGIENLTIDHVGYVYWKGQEVEHYDSPWRWSPAAKKAAEELVSRCKVLEERGIPVNSANAIWNWPDNKPKEQLIIIPEYDPIDPKPYPGDIKPGYYSKGHIESLLAKHNGNPDAVQFLHDMMGN